ncbi:MAG: DUF3108 domain-containing protein [Bryobacteraceae bacterium]
MRALALACLGVAAQAQTGFPFQDETLHYTINFPSGLSLGEGTMAARRNRETSAWHLELKLDASLAGLALTDRYRSVASGYCSSEFEKESEHGPRKARETVVIGGGIAKRATKGGGTSSYPVGECARDALTFLYYTRRELGQGRVPAPETIVFGGPYQMRLEYTGAQTVTVGGKPEISDRVVVHLKGPASATRLEMYFARDAARTPLVVKAPLALGTFSLELVRQP